MDAFLSNKRNIQQNLRKRIWELYIGIGVKEATCPLCGTNTISVVQNSGFQACHVVADGYHTSKKLTVFDVFPGCATCNNECADACLIDFLYNRQRFGELRRFMWNVYTAFITQHADELAHHERMCWRVIQHLYGRARYPAGGGIVNEKQVYEIARAEQCARLAQDIGECNDKLQEMCRQLQHLMSCDIKPMTLLM